MSLRKRTERDDHKRRKTQSSSKPIESYFGASNSSSTAGCVYETAKPIQNSAPSPAITEDSPTENAVVNKRSRGVNHFRNQWFTEEKNREKWLQKADEFTAKCTVCNVELMLQNDGLKAVKCHEKSNTHTRKMESAEYSTAVTNFYSEIRSAEEDMISAAELALTYHGVKHGHSYNSQDCGNKLLPAVLSDSKIASKLSCGRTKASSYVENILCPYVEETVVNEIKHSNFVSISSDASNKGNRKMFPVIVQYFDRNEGTKKGLLGFYEDTDESSDAIFRRICSVLEDKKIPLCKVSAYCADNTSVNYGKNISVYEKMKDKNPNIVKANCNAHILHNCAKHASKQLHFDVENLVNKIYSEFSTSSRKVADLREFFEFVNSDEYLEFLRYVPFRWLSMQPAIERVLFKWDTLRSYFLSQDQDDVADVILKAFPESENKHSVGFWYVSFLHKVLEIFTVALKRIQSDEQAVTDLHDIMSEVRRQLQCSKADKFYRFPCEQALKHDGISDSERKLFLEDADNFISKAVSYLEKWYDYDQSVYKLCEPFGLKNGEMFSWVEVTDFLARVDIDINKDTLYNEFNLLRRVVSEDCSVINIQKSVSGKWVAIFKRLPDITELVKIICFILSIPLCNAFCERVFSQMGLSWTGQRNKLSCALLKSELMVKTNCALCCKEFYTQIKGNKKLLTEARSHRKYKFKK